MSDKLKLLTGGPQQENANDRGIAISPSIGRSGRAALNNRSSCNRLWPRPFTLSDTSPLAWWRTLPPSAFGDAERPHLLTTLKQIDMLHGGDDFAAALKGDPSAAIGVAFTLMPIKEMSLTTDIAMTALLQCALEPNSTAALVLAQVLGLSDVGHPYATELAASWLAHGQRYSANPSKYSEAGKILLAAFRERHRHGDEA
jgi:hypothetical protein